MNKAELTDFVRKNYGKSYKNEEAMMATEDGMVFTMDKHNAAKDHEEKSGKKLHKIIMKEEAPAAPAELPVPTEESTVAEIKAYLDQKDIEYNSSDKKADLLALLTVVKTENPEPTEGEGENTENQNPE